MVKYINKIDKGFLNEVIKGYVATIGEITADERTELRKWVLNGNSVCENPWLIYDDNGFMMDFISAFRIDEDMTNYMHEYFRGSQNCAIDDTNELPF